MRGSPIPTTSRVLVKTRDAWSCVRCGVPIRVSEWHHRRSRSVVDEHQHAACNGISLCAVCHPWVHSHPFEARSQGWIVSRHANPCDEPVFVNFGGSPQWVLLNHLGLYVPTTSPEEA